MTIMSNIFFDAAHTEIVNAKRKEEAISAFRDEQNVEPNKLFAIAHLAVVAKSLRLDEANFKGRKAIAGSFRKMIVDAGVKEAKAKLLAENAIKFARHGEFGNAVEAATRHNSTGDFAQEIGATFAALEITTQSKLVALLNPKEDRTPAQVLAIAALKAAGAKAGDITVTAKRVSTGTVADDDAAQVLLDAVALILPGAADVAATLVDAINSADLDKAA
jgi:hypothetical protein